MTEFKIEQRQILWKKKLYKTVEHGKHFTIKRPYEFNLNEELEKLLRRKKKWE